MIVLVRFAGAASVAARRIRMLAKRVESESAGFITGASRCSILTRRKGEKELDKDPALPWSMREREGERERRREEGSGFADATSFISTLGAHG